MQKNDYVNLDTPPRGFAKYKKWFVHRSGLDTYPKYEEYYKIHSTGMLSAFIETPFWKEVKRVHGAWGEEYMLQKSVPLFVNDSVHRVVTKPCNSFIQKAYRHDVLNNTGYPDEPSTGWSHPDSSILSFNDIIRTMIVVKYIDGVRYVAEMLSKLAAEHRLKCTVDYEAKFEGYYAAHFNVRTSCTITSKNWDPKPINHIVEIQITTQLQEVIKTLLHKHYESRRMSSNSSEWQWDYSGPEFAANYLGHILHYLEGMIVEVRDRPLP